MSKDMRLEIPAHWLPTSAKGPHDKYQKALLAALMRAFSIGTNEACEAAKRAYGAGPHCGLPVDKIIVLCTPSQFGTFVAARCELGGRNLIQDLKARELRDNQAEPGIGQNGTVFDVRPTAKMRVQVFPHSAKAAAVPPGRPLGAMYVDELKDWPSPSWAAQAFMHGRDKHSGYHWIDMDFGNMEAHVLASIPTPQEPKVRIVWENRARHAGKTWEQFVKLYGSDTPDFGAWSQHESRVHRQKPGLEERLREVFGIHRKPAAPTWREVLDQVKAYVQTGALNWTHVRAIKAVFGIEHHRDLTPDQTLCYLKAVQSVVEARKSGQKRVSEMQQELKATRQTTVRLEIDSTNLRMELRAVEAHARKYKMLADSLEAENKRLEQENIKAKAERNRARETNNLQYMEIKRLQAQCFTSDDVQKAYNDGREHERKAIVESMERHATQKFELAEVSRFGSISNKLRAGCYSLREHARQIRDRII